MDFFYDVLNSVLGVLILTLIIPRFVRWKNEIYRKYYQKKFDRMLQKFNQIKAFYSDEKKLMLKINMGWLSCGCIGASSWFIFPILNRSSQEFVLHNPLTLHFSTIRDMTLLSPECFVGYCLILIIWTCGENLGSGLIN